MVLTFTSPDGGLDGVLSSTAVADAVTGGTMSAGHVMEYCLANVAAKNPTLNAIVALRDDDARLDAGRLDAELTVGHPAGRLAGVPFTVKDVIATSQLPTTCGSKVLRDYRPDKDATVVTRLRGAGATLVGKSNCPEFAFSIDTRNDLFGRTLNPLGDFTPGGSSGGESAALAAGMSALGIGSDFGGSVRWPAQCVGIAGLRPTVGRVPTTGLVPALSDGGPPNSESFQGRIQVIGALGSSTNDLERALEVMSGPDGIDPLAVDRPLHGSAQVVLHKVEARYGCRVDDQSVDPVVSDAVEFAINALRRNGVSVYDGLPVELNYGAVLYSKMRAADSHDEIARVSAGREDELTPFSRELLNERTTNHGLPPIEKLWEIRDYLSRRLFTWLSGDRVLILPVACQPPLWTSDALLLAGSSQFNIMAPSRAISIFGVPSLSVPCIRTADGRPISVQVVGPPFREDLVLAVGRCIELASEPQSPLA